MTPDHELIIDLQNQVTMLKAQNAALQAEIERLNNRLSISRDKEMKLLSDIIVLKESHHE